MILHELTIEIDFIKLVFKIVIKRPFGELNNVFQDEFEIILSQHSTNVGFLLSHNYI